MKRSRRTATPRRADEPISETGIARIARIIVRVRAIPHGFVRTYGDIDPRAPRLVGRVLSTTHDLPWHRVVRADGIIPRGEGQRQLLRAEGVPMRGDKVDLREARVPREAELPE